MNNQQLDDIQAILSNTLKRMLDETHEKITSVLKALIEANLKYEAEKAHKEYLDSITPVFEPEPPLPDNVEVELGNFKPCELCGRKTPYRVENRPCCANCYNRYFRIDDETDETPITDNSERPKTANISMRPEGEVAMCLYCKERPAEKKCDICGHCMNELLFKNMDLSADTNMPSADEAPAKTCLNCGCNLLDPEYPQPIEGDLCFDCADDIEEMSHELPDILYADEAKRMMKEYEEIMSEDE